MIFGRWLTTSTGFHYGTVVNFLGMTESRARQLRVAGIGVVLLVAALFLWGSNAFNVRENIRELTFDQVLRLLAPQKLKSSVVVVDIDSDSLTRHGPWPWGRLVIADLLKKIAQSKPLVIGLDILLSEPDRLSPAGLMRSLGVVVDRKEIVELANRLRDGDAAVADSLIGTPSVLGFVLDPGANTSPPPGVPILARGPIEVPDIWQASGAVGPLETIAAAGRGFGAMVLASDANGEVRRVPLLVAISGRLRPGFAVEMLRVQLRSCIIYTRYGAAAVTYRALVGSDRY